MKLTLSSLKNTESWKNAEIRIPGYDVEKIRAKAVEAPRWVHFGIGNIFRIFLGSIADDLIEEESLDRGITCVEAFDYDVVDKIYTPFDNLVLSVVLHSDGSREKRVLASLSEAVKANSDDEKSWERLKEIFTSKDLQIVSFTITEKGYALKAADGTFLPLAAADIEAGPKKAKSAMGIVAAMLLERYKAGGAPIACVSMDNCSKNGDLFASAVKTLVQGWKVKGYVDDGFAEYVSNPQKVSFPWTMIDKITPRPAEKIADDLEALGIENMQPVITSKYTYIAPFVNAEGPQYLVVEDAFPNGRPALEKAGVYLADRDTVNKSERMKVTVCLNPIHTALGPYGCVLGYELFSDVMGDADLHKLAEQVGYVEGMHVVPDPEIISPKAFLDELMTDRFPNPYLGDTNMRLCTDASQMLGVRFGVTIRSYMEKYGDGKKLTAIPLAIAGWLRYLLGVDDNGNAYDLAPDPMAEEVIVRLSDIKVGQPETLKDQLKWILSNENIFYVNLYDAGLGELIEQMFREEIAGPGAVRKTIKKYLAI